MSREPIRIHRSFQTSDMHQMLLWGISRRFHRLSPWYGQVAHVLRTLPPVAAKVLLPRAAPRLACVKPAASVHPEPGSNSSLYISLFSQLEPDTLNSKRINALDYLFVSRYLLVLIFQYYQWTCPCLSERECKGMWIFYSNQIFFSFFCFFMTFIRICQEICILQPPKGAVQRFPTLHQGRQLSSQVLLSYNMRASRIPFCP